MTKIQITDEQVLALRHHIADKTHVYLSVTDSRALLEDSLNPPSDPEIVVTEEMAKAGGEAVYPYLDHMNWKGHEQVACLVYRAMRRLERSRVTCIPTPLGWSHTRKDDPGTTIGDMRYHRRKDDR